MGRPIRQNGSDEEREERIEKLRQSYNDGTLDISIRPNDPRLDRLLDAIFPERKISKHPEEE